VCSKSTTVTDRPGRPAVVCVGLRGSAVKDKKRC
jgi:hypothetical protein